MYTYLGTLKEGFKYDKNLKSYLKDNNVIVLKHLTALNTLIIQSEKNISKDDLLCFETLEMERDDFTI
jgi:hypothetical protein